MSVDHDVVIVGGGFFGCSLALCLSAVTDRVLVIEAEDELLERASRVNQARVHAGFHYPRSFTTALRSRFLQDRFARDFPHAVVDDFAMIYAIAARRSKVSASRFAHTFRSLDAPFAKAPSSQRALFNPQLIEDVFTCREHAFDYAALRAGLRERLHRHGVTVWTGTQAQSVTGAPDHAIVHLADGRSVTATSVFNVTYANINHLLITSGLRPIQLKHELAEVALVAPPPELAGLAVTVMDGPFFSSMPYPSERLYSLTHVRYTPHFSWEDGADGRSPYEVIKRLPRESRWRHMMQDASRYMPCMQGVGYAKSLYDVKTVLVRNEIDDGRPILLHQHADCPRLTSIMGAKIDNIYDLLEVLPQVDARWTGLSHERLVG